MEQKKKVKCNIVGSENARKKIYKTTINKKGQPLLKKIENKKSKLEICLCI